MSEYGINLDNKAVNELKEAVGGGGTTVIANEELTGDEETLTELTVDGIKYKVPQGGGETPHLYEIKVSFGDDGLIELVCLSTESINNLEDITDDTVITDTIWNDLIKLKDKLYDIHLRTVSDTALLSGGNISFFTDDETNEINDIYIWTVICYADSGSHIYTTSGQQSNSIDIIKLEDNQGYQVSCNGIRTPRNITCKQIF